MSPFQKVEIVGLENERKAIERGVRLDIPILIVGPTGCGKTTLLKEIAVEQSKELIRISLNGEVGIPELVGKWLIEGKNTVWQDGVLIEAMRKGHWVVFDEINAALPEVLFCLNSVLDDARSLRIAEKDGELVEAHPDFRAFATMNPSGDYAGTKELNYALLSRFGIMLDTDYAVPKKELAIIQRTGINEEIGKIVIDVGTQMRKLYKEQSVNHLVSTRDLLTMSRLLVDGATMRDALMWAIINKVEKEIQVETFNNIKEALKLEINWNSTAETVLKNLTEDLVLSVAKLKEQESQLRALVTNLQQQLLDISKAIPARGEASS